MTFDLKSQILVVQVLSCYNIMHHLSGYMSFRYDKNVCNGHIYNYYLGIEFASRYVVVNYFRESTIK